MWTLVYNRDATRVSHSSLETWGHAGDLYAAAFERPIRAWAARVTQTEPGVWTVLQVVAPVGAGWREATT